MRKLFVCSAVALLAWGCKDGGTTPSVATTVAVTPAAPVTLDAVGATQVVRAAVTDQKGKAMRNAALSWSSSSGAVTISAAGGDSAVVTAAGNGAATVTATSGSASGTVPVQVSQVATGLQKGGGDGQNGPAGTPLPVPLQVRVRDRLGAAVPGVTVTFELVGGGSLPSPTAVSGADGVARATWTLGTLAGSTQLVTATAPGVPSVQFSATVVAGPAAAAVVAAGDNQVAARGTAVPVAPRVLVRDAFANPVAGVNVQFTVTTGGGSVAGATQTTDSNGGAVVGGWTLGDASGTHTLTASFPGTGVPAVVFTATAGVAGTVSASSAANQAAMVGTAVPAAPSVVVRDGAGNPLAGMSVTFTAAGGGTVGAATATTNASGVASAGSWVLGPQAGPNTVTATVAGITAPAVVFRGAGCAGGGAGYALTLCFTTSMTSAQRAVFQNAAARWATVITGDLADVSGSIPAGSCGTGSPAMSMSFDDLVIFAAVEHIDGPGQVLGSAGWCYRRTGGLPVIGLMRFDAADVSSLEQRGQFGSVILHEMGHVVGIGTLWSAFRLLQNPSSSSTPLDTYFSGSNGIAGFDAIGGRSYTGGQKVPVENTGGPGTMNGHWRESVLGNELMTGYLDAGVPNPLSLLTVQSLVDLGYTVDVNAADAFSLAFSMRANGEGPRLHLHDDLYTGPRYTIDRQGRLTRLSN